MRAEVIAIGSELTCGARVDTNSQWLSQQLEALGWSVHRHTTVADDREALIRLFQEAAGRSRIVMITGGLGPTLDDLTRETLAAAFDQELIQDDAALRYIQSLFQARGREMPPRNKVQALRPAQAQVIHNAHGTAPGIWLERHNPACLLVAMPGVPAEMKHMFRDEVVPRLPPAPVCVRRTVIRTFGMGESDVESRLGELTARGRNPEVGITASSAVISLSVTARAGTPEECSLLLDETRKKIIDTLGSVVFGEGDVELPDVVRDLLRQQKVRVVLFEGRTTGGLIAHMLTDSDDVEGVHVVSRVLADEEFPGSDSAHQREQWKALLTAMAKDTIADGSADFVIVTSPTRVSCKDGVSAKQGYVLLHSAEDSWFQDVSMTGNLAIFRKRAALTAINLLRLVLQDVQRRSAQAVTEH